MGFISEFKDFAMRGNVMDMAVGIVIGGAFGKIIASLVTDVLMPPIGLLMGGVNFAEQKLELQEGTPAVLGSDGTTVETPAVEAVYLNYGAFIDTIISFVIIALAIFVVIKMMNSAKRKEEEAPAAPPEPSAEEKLLTEIRDALKTR